MKVLNQDERSFLREFNIVKPLLDEAQRIATSIHILAKDRSNLKRLKIM